MENSQEKLVTVVTDNGANDFGKRKHLPCVTHTLNLSFIQLLDNNYFKLIIHKVFKENVNADHLFTP